MLLLVPAAMLIGCAARPMTVDVEDLPPIVRSAQVIEFKVRVTSYSSENLSIPSRRAIAVKTSLGFIPGGKGGTMVSKVMRSDGLISGDYGLVRNSLNECPPQFDSLDPAGTRVYEFSWKPEDDDHGVGAFRIALPPGFPEIPLQPMNIKD
jgi:hypothetical protein